MVTTTSMFESLPYWPPAVDPMLWAGVVLVIAAAGGEWAGRRGHVPRITVYTLLGLVAGWLGVFGSSDQILVHWRGFIDAALGLLLFRLGGVLRLRWLLDNKWLAFTSLMESVVTAGTVFVVLSVFGVGRESAALIAVIMMSTSPAVAVSLVMEQRGRGQVSERLLMMSFINSGLAIVSTRVWLGLEHLSLSAGHTAETLFHAIYLVSGSVLLGYLIGKLLSVLGRMAVTAGDDLVLLFGMTLAIVYSAQALHLSPLFAFVVAGLCTHSLQAGSHQKGEADLLRLFQIVLFVLMGAAAKWGGLLSGKALLFALLLLGMRTMCKVGVNVVLARLSGLTLQQGTALGLALIPMSDVAFLLTQDASTLLPETGGDVRLGMLLAIAVFELIGPKVALCGLFKAGEVAAEPEPSNVKGV